MKNVIVLAGGIWQYCLVSYLKTVGYYVVVVNPAITDTTKLADHHILCDVKDEATIINEIGKFQPAFICSDQSDVTPRLVARISRHFGLPCNSVEAVELFLDKLKMFLYAESQGIDMPCTIPVDGKSKLSCFPSVIKPADSNSSKGFAIVYDQASVEEAVANAAQHSKQVIAQSYVPGRQVTLDGFCSGGKHRTLAAASIGFCREGIINSVRYPFVDPIVGELIAMNDRYVKNSGLDFGITHAEYRYNEDKTVLLEIAARGGGSGTSSILTPWVTGISMYDLLVRSLQGQQINLNELEVKQRHAWLEYFEFPTGVAHGDLERAMCRVKQIPCVAEFKFNFRLHEKLAPATTGQQRHGLVMLLGDCRDELDEALTEVYDTLQSEGWLCKR